MAATNRPADDWTDVAEESQIKFTEDGDVFTGLLSALDENGGIPQAHFVGTGDFAGSDFFTNMGHDLAKKLSKVPLDSEVRITRTGTLDVGQKSPMMIFSVAYRR